MIYMIAILECYLLCGLYLAYYTVNPSIACTAHQNMQVIGVYRWVWLLWTMVLFWKRIFLAFWRRISDGHLSTHNFFPIAWLGALQNLCETISALKKMFIQVSMWCVQGEYAQQKNKILVQRKALPKWFTGIQSIQIGHPEHWGTSAVFWGHCQ